MLYKQPFAHGFPLALEMAAAAISTQPDLEIADVREIYNNLRALPFIDATAKGLVFQDVVRETISKELERRDPERYRKLRRRAYSYFTKQSHRAVANH